MYRPGNGHGGVLMASSVMNGRLRSVPTPHGGPVVSALPLTLPKTALSICSIGRPAKYNEHPNFSSRGSDGATTADVHIHHPNEDCFAIHTGLNEGFPMNDITSHGEKVVDHCWWAIPSLKNGSLIKHECSACMYACSQQSEGDATNKEFSSISILAVLARCQNNTATLRHVASTSSSIVRLFLYTSKCDSKIISKNGVHIASIPTSYHATAIAMGGEGLNGLLVIARSSGMELHCLQPILEKYLEGRCQSCSELLKNDIEQLKATEATIEPVKEVKDVKHLERTPMRPSSTIPTTPLAPKSLSMAFEDVSIQNRSPSQPLPSSHQPQSPSITLSDHTAQILHQTDPIELLQSFCVHALHLSYPYLVVASGDRVGIWNVDCKLLSRPKPNETRNTFHRDVQEALWTTTISGSRNVHRRVTSIYITQHGEAMALSCWDGSAFIYVANSTSRVDVGTSHRHPLVTSWELISETIDSSYTSPWEKPTVQNSTDSVFPTFISLRSDNQHVNEVGNGLFGRRGPGSLFMAVSTPYSNMIRLFDVFSGIQCPDNIVTGNHKRLEIHGMVNASPANSYGKDELVWVTENDVICSRQWSEIIQTGACNRSKDPYRVDRKKIASTCVRSMKQQSNRFLIAESSDKHVTHARKTSKAYLYWGKIPPQSTSSSEISTWTVQCQWCDLEEIAHGQETVVSAPFLIESDVLDLIQQGSETDIHRRTQAIFNQNFLAIVIPSYAMMYVHARDCMSWKMIDLQDYVDLLQDTSTPIAIKVIIHDSSCFVLMLDEQARIIHVRVFHLSSLFNDAVIKYERHHCSIPDKQTNSLSTVEVLLIDENVKTFVVLCFMSNEDKKGLRICKYSQEKCHLESDCFLTLPPSFTVQLEHLQFISAFSLSRIKDEFHEHQDFSNIPGLDGDDLVIQFQLQCSAWLCIPSVNIWRPL